MKRPGPAASCTTRASIAACTGWRVEAAMIPQPIVSRFVSRAHQRGDAGRGARLHPVLAPPRIRLGEPDRVHPGLVHRARRGEHLVERLHRELHDADPERRRHYCFGGFLHLRVERGEDVLHLLVHDRLQDALAHRADRPEDLHLGAPRHRGAALGGVGERERRLHVHHRADAVALDRELRELRLALLDLLHVDLHLQAAEAERDLHVRRPAPVVVDVEALDARHRLRHRRGVVQHLPDGRRAARRRSRSPETFTPAPPAAAARRAGTGCGCRSRPARSRPGSRRRRRGCRRRRPRPCPSCRAA